MTEQATEKLKPVTPHPLKVLKDERGKTRSAKQTAQQAIADAGVALDRQKSAISAEYTQAYTAAEAEGQKVVDAAQDVLTAAYDEVEEILKLLAAAQAKEAEAATALKATAAQVTKDLEAKNTELQATAADQINDATAEHNDIVAAQRAAVSAERKATVVHLVKEIGEEGLAVVDGTIASLNAVKGAVSKVFTSLGQIAKEGAKEGWEKPTKVTEKRRKEPGQSA